MTIAVRPKTGERTADGERRDRLMNIVYLIGAGPGDPGLITVRGLQCLATADVVLYDHLVLAAPAARTRAPDAEKIDVGVAAPQPLEQEAICYLLAEKAREGKTVARLKWGDPFVFDRGGAEALFLHEQGVRFEVVPGIPAGIAVPTYAGVPITYPGGGDTLTFVRGHEDEGKSSASIDWASLRATRRHDRLLRGSAAAAAHPDRARRARPADRRFRRAWSTTARCRSQETLDGTLEEIAKRDRA